MRRIHHGWIILILVFFSIIVAGIIRSSSGIFVIPFEQEFGWSRGEISLAFGLGLFMYGIAGPFMGSFIQILGIKRMMIASMGSLIIGLILSLFMTQTWQLLLLWGIIIGLGSSLFLTVLSPYIANTWFVKRRGLAVGILTASTATGQLILLPVLASVIETYNWKVAIMIITALGFIMLIFIFIFMKNSPKDIGISPYGGDKNASIMEGEEKRKNPFRLAIEPLLQAIKVKEFWMLAGSFFICGLSTSGLIGTHFVSYCVGFGFAAVTAASLLSLMGIFDLIGTTLSGFLSDRIDNRWLLFWYYLLRGISLMLLPVALYNGSFLMLAIFAVFYGLDWIATVPPTINISRQLFGVKNSVIIYGWIFAFHQLGAFAASYGAGKLFQNYSTYTGAFVGAGVMCILATLFVIVIPKKTNGLHSAEN